MKKQTLCYLLILTVFCTFLVESCQQSTAEKTANRDTAVMQKKPVDTYSLTLDEEQAEETMTREPAAEEPVPATEKVSTPKSTPQKETFYVSTYGANGKVWGHVTMTGNTGRGTIHDEDENSLSITVTRHGGELYGVDQNGRQYVFTM